MCKEKYEIRATASYEGGDEITTMELQTAYSIANNMAVASNLLYGRGGGENEKEQTGKDTYFDFAVGYFKPIDKQYIFEVLPKLAPVNRPIFIQRVCHRLLIIQLLAIPVFSFNLLLASPLLGLMLHLLLDSVD